MNRSKRRSPQQISLGQWMVWGIIIIAILVLNYWYLNKYLSFNTSYITDFIAPEDSLAEYRNPALSSIFYETDTKKQEVANLQGHFNYSKEYNPKIVIVPFSESLASAGSLGKVYNLLQKIGRAHV